MPPGTTPYEKEQLRILGKINSNLETLIREVKKLQPTPVVNVPPKVDPPQTDTIQ